MTTRLHAIPMGAKALVAVLFAALFFFGVQPPAAHAIAPVDITVNVTTKAGAAIPGLFVSALPVANHTVIGDPIDASPVTSKQFTLNDLDPGQLYAIYFDGPGSATASFDQFWGGTTWVEEATYRSWLSDSSLDVTLATNSTFTGKVTGTGNKALAGVDVYAFRWDGNDWFQPTNAVCGCAVSATTNSVGMYTMRNLEPGSYRLEFRPDNLTGYLSEYSGNVTVFDHAAAYNIGLGATITSNAMLAVGGTLAGTVHLTQVGAPGNPAGITAFAYPVLPGGAIDVDHVYTSAQTTFTGKWAVPGLPAGTYKVKLYDTYYFGDIYIGDFIDKWAGLSGGGTTVDDPNTQQYPVTLGHLTTVPGATDLIFADDLGYPTSLDLTILDANGDPLGPDADILIQSTTGEDWGYSGPLTGFPFVPVGQYRVWVQPNDTISQPYIGLQNVVSTVGGNNWSIHLDPVSAFTYDTPATIAATATPVGTTYDVSVGQTSLDDATGQQADVHYSYLWLRDAMPIYGSQSDTSHAYTTKGSDLGHAISVIVRADAFGYDPVFTTVTAVSPVTVGAAPVNLTLPSVTGPASPVPGSTLTADPGTWSLGSVSFAYQWLHNGAPIAGATARTYKVDPFTATETIDVQVIATRSGYTNSAPATSVSSIVIGRLPAPILTKAPMFTVTPLAGGDFRLSATSGTWSPAPTSYSFTWSVDGTYLTSTGGLPVNCLTFGVDCTGKTIEVIIGAYKTGYIPGAKYYVVRKGTATPTLNAGSDVHIEDQTDGGTHLGLGVPAEVGHVVKAIPPIFDYAGTGGLGGTITNTYQWQVQTNSISPPVWGNIPGATHQTWAPTKTYVGKFLRVKITTVSSLYPSVVTTYSAGDTIYVRYNQDLVQAPPAVSVAGTTNVGTTKLAVVGGWPLAGVANSYQWWYCDGSAAVCVGSFPDGGGATWHKITGATASTYTPAASFENDYIGVGVTGSKSGYQAMAAYSAEFGPLTPASNAAAIFVDPYISGGLLAGHAVVGHSVTATPAVLDRPATRVNEWQTCPDATCTSSAPIGVTTTTFVPNGSLLADNNPHWIRFLQHVTVGSSTYDLATFAVPLDKGTWAPTKAPSIVAAADSGGPGPTKYTVNGGTWPGGVSPSFSFDWNEYTSPVGVTTPFYNPPAGAEAIWVAVTVKRPGYNSLTFNVAARKGLFHVGPTTFDLTGTTFGDSLHLTTPLSTPLDPAAKIAYQWYSGSTAITGAKSASFTPSSAYVGKVLKLRITITSPFHSVAPVFTPTVTLLKHPAPSGSPLLVSTPSTFEPGAKLTVNTSSFGAGFTYTYKWERSPDGVQPYVPISTASSYIIKPTDPDQLIHVLVTASKAGWLPATMVPTPAYIINGSGPAQLTAPLVLTGSGKVDTVLTAAPKWNATGLTLTYSWTRNGVTIPGATFSTLTPTASWWNDELQAHVTATKPGWYPATVHSNPITVLQGNAPTAAVSSLTISPTIAHAGSPVTVSPGVWNVSGLTFTYHWYLATDILRLNELANTATFTPPSVDNYRAYVLASRDGYEMGIQARLVVVQP